MRHTLDAITDIGGTPKEILELAEARKLFEPILRNDFRICETYELRPDGARLGCPAHVFVAEEDNMVDAEAAVGWQDYVSSDFTLYSLSGKHMLEKRALDTLLDKMVLLWLGGA